jgi:uncharacterized protein (TIGR02996 family)
VNFRCWNCHDTGRVLVPDDTDREGTPRYRYAPCKQCPEAPPMDDYKTDGRLILDRVLAEPQDDMHRLAYADWLMEHGNEGQQDRGRFIQLQIEYHNLVNGGVPHLDPQSAAAGHPNCFGFDPHDELPKCPLCRARVRLERHLKEYAHHGRYVLDGTAVIESREVKSARHGRPFRLAWTWVRGFKKSLVIDRETWMSATWRDMGEWGPRSVLWHPIDRVTFEDARPHCGQCRYTHWGRLAPSDQQARTTGPASWHQNVLPDDVWAELDPHREGEFHAPAVPAHFLYDYRRGWYPPYGSHLHDELNRPLGSDARGELERRYTEQAHADLSQAALKVMRKLAEAIRESEESSPAGVDN